MRTYFNVVIASRSVFGFGLDRVVSSLNATCAHAAQHHATRHADQRARESLLTLARRGWDYCDNAGADPWLKRMRLAISGPQGRTVRLTSPVGVMA